MLIAHEHATSLQSIARNNIAKNAKQALNSGASHASLFQRVIMAQGADLDSFDLAILDDQNGRASVFLRGRRTR
jgi:hypothetical protein